MLIAITRPVSPSLAQCELTHLTREPINVTRARAQHTEYEATLESLGVRVEQAAAAPDMPDAVFVEDTAVVVPEMAVITRPGAASRRPEVAGVADILRKYRKLVRIEAPGTIDGGDVLRVGMAIYVGRSARTNDAGIAQLQRHFQPLGYSVHAVEVSGCLHLKSAVTQIGKNLVLVNSAWIPMNAFAGIDRLEIDPSEPMAANGLLIKDTVVYPQHFPRTLERLVCHGLKVETVPADELAKAEGAVTCCSIILET